MMPLLLGRGRPDRRHARGARNGCWARWGSPAGWTARRTACRAASSSASPLPARWRWTRLLVLADEPTGNLDTKSADAVFELMREVNRERGTTFLIVTHNPRLARRCDRIVEVVDGQVQSDRRVGAD